MKLKEKNNLLSELVQIVEILRAPNGCDWDKEQTSQSLIPYFIEEAYEVIEAIELNDSEALKEELGDILLHLVFQISIAKENKKFQLNDVILGINNKLINRHPHIFNNTKDHSWKEDGWEKSKQKEKNRDSVLDGVPKSMPALLRARRIQEKAAGVGFDWKEIKPVISKVKEEISELEEAIKQNTNIEEELGDVLFSVVNISRHLDLNPELSLKKSIEKFYSRFVKLEKKIKKEDLEMTKMSLVQLDHLWEKCKKNK